MWRKNFALLLVIAWVALSSFNVLEDLERISVQIVISSFSPGDNSNAKLRGRGILANNIIESATDAHENSSALFSFAAIIFSLDPLRDLRRQFALYKLYRVFLI